RTRGCQHLPPIEAAGERTGPARGGGVPTQPRIGKPLGGETATVGPTRIRRGRTGCQPGTSLAPAGRDRTGRSPYGRGRPDPGQAPCRPHLDRHRGAPTALLPVRGHGPGVSARPN